MANRRKTNFYLTLIMKSSLSCKKITNGYFWFPLEKETFCRAHRLIKNYNSWQIPNIFLFCELQNKP